MDLDQFQVIGDMARRHYRTFSGELRVVIDRGLASLSESEVYQKAKEREMSLMRNGR